MQYGIAMESQLYLTILQVYIGVARCKDPIPLMWNLTGNS